MNKYQYFTIIPYGKTVLGSVPARMWKNYMQITNHITTIKLHTKKSFFFRINTLSLQINKVHLDIEYYNRKLN